MALDLILFYGSALLAIIILAFCIFTIAVSSEFPIIERTSKEQHFIDDITGSSIPFPSLEDKCSLDLSVIIPAYNEETRLPVMLEECTGYLETLRREKNLQYEIILVSDGSMDGTCEVGRKWASRLGADRFRVLALETNRGKGGAVRIGMLSARGAYLLFADADGATKFADLEKLQAALTEVLGVDFWKDRSAVADNVAIAIGSRAHLEDAAIASRSFFRTVLMYGFHFLVWLFTVKGIRDTQCGFKLFTRKAAQICFTSIHVERWAFDVELLYIAQKLNIPIKEVAVNWTEIEGSKLTPVWSWIQMGRDLALIWLRYLIGAWKIKAKSVEKTK